jgi:hypothetical protein
MAQNFPSNPTIGNSYTVNNESWTYDGSGWTRATTATANAILPAQTGNSGKYLTTDGTSASWGTVAAAVPKITSISVTDNSYTVLDDTAVSTTGGYIKITGTGFTAGSQILIGTVAASSVSWISSTELRAQVPATAAGTYVVYVVATDGAVAIRVNGITFSATPTWSTGSSLGTSGTAISIQLAAVSDTAITYSLAAGSTLPTGLTLSSSGLLSGTVTGITVDTVYNFTINAIDLENQDSPRTFSITITVKDAYFSYVPLLLETAAVSARSTVVTDSSTNAFTVTRNGTPSTGWISPYQTDGYWGNYFDAARIALAYSAASDISSGNFTIEFFVNAPLQTNANGVRGIAFFNGAPVTTASIGWDIIFGDSGTNTIKFEFCSGSSNAITIATTGGLNSTWNHVAVTRSGSTFTIWLNGVSQATGTSSATGNTNAAWATYAGSISTNNTGASNNLYISNFRIVKGQVLATGNFTPPASPLTTTTVGWTGANAASSLTGTVPILTCQSNRFIDNSSNNLSITISGTPQVTAYFYPSTFTAPSASPGAGYFNGTTDYLTTPANAAFAFGTGDFTVECWMYITYALGTTGQGRGVLVSNRSVASSNTTLCLQHYNSKIYFGTASTDLIISTATLTINTWTHIAVSRSSGILRLFVNGVLDTTVASNTTNFSDTNAFAIGADGLYLGYYFTGYISNTRMVKGTAVYTGAFAPPTGFLTTTGGTYSSTTNVNTSITASNTSLLVNLADSNYTSATNGVQNNTFIDTGPYAFTITRNGTPTQGSVTPYWPDGYWGNYFNGSTDYFGLGSQTNLQLSNSDFTIETWIYPQSTGVMNIFGNLNDGLGAGSYWFIVNLSAGSLFQFATGTGINVLKGSGTLSLNNWHHIAVTRSGANIRLYLDGAQVGTTDTSIGSGTITSSGNAFTIGRASVGSVYYVNGYLSNLRLVVGTPLYTGSTYTVPTTPLSPISGTQLLTCQSNRFRDNSTNNFTLTANGTPRVQAFQPFSPTASYTTALYGGSGYFNGSTDYLTVASNSGLAFGTNNFTIEFWVYLNTVSGTQIFYSSQTSGSYTVAPDIYQLNGKLYVQVSSGNPISGTGPTTLVANRWYHIALVKSSGTSTLYVNGASEASFSDSNTYVIGANRPVIGVYGYSAANYYLSGYLSNLRVVNGTAIVPPAGGPTTPVTNVTNTSLLLNMTNAGIYDAAVQNNLITGGTAQASSTITPKWGTTSMKFNGATTDYLYAPVNSADTFGSGNWTVEGWFNFSSVSGNQEMFSKESLNAAQSGIRCVLTSARVQFQLSSNGSTYATTVSCSTALTTGVWYYLAFVRNGTAITVYLNGTSDGTGSFTGALYETNTFWALASRGLYSAGTSYNGYIQDFRITKGVARTITASPTAAFQTK